MPTLTWSGKALPAPTRTQFSIYETSGTTPTAELYCGNNLSWLASAKELQAPFNLIYLDPPFCSQANYTQTFNIDGTSHRQPAFGDIFSVDEYLQFIYERLLLLKDVLADTGSLFLHCDHQQSHHIRAILDEVFGASQFRNEIIWHYTGGGRAKRYFSRKHDSIFWYTKNRQWTFNPDPIRVPYKASSGYAKGGITSKTGKKYLPNPKGTIPDDTWNIPILNPLAKERTGYPTQKPQALLDRIILACSNPGDRVLDPFMGSGTTGISALQHGRRFVGIDQNWNSVHTMRHRLFQSNTAYRIAASTAPTSFSTPIRVDASSDRITAQPLDSNQPPIQSLYGQSSTGHWTADIRFCNRLRAVNIAGQVAEFTVSAPLKHGMILHGR